MPAVNDYDPNDEKQGGGFGADGSSGSSSGGGALFGGASPQHEQQYTPWDRFTSANSDVSSREAGKLQGQVGADVDSAMGGLNSANNAYNAGIAAQYAPQPGNNQSAGARQAASANTGAVGAQQAFGGSQWAAFGGAPAAAPPATLGTQGATASPSAPKGIPAGPSAKPPAPPQQSTLNASSLTAMPQANAQTVATGAAGPKDLESSMSPDVWAGLTGKVNTANQEATALGNESGVQALLSQNTGAPASSFDAALINGAGGGAFQQTAQKFGNGVLPGQQVNSEQASQDAWGKLTGNVDSQRQVAQDAAEREQYQKDLNWANRVGAPPPSHAAAAADPGVNGNGTPNATVDANRRADWQKQAPLFVDAAGNPSQPNAHGGGKPYTFGTKSDFLGHMGNYEAWVKAGRPNTQGKDGAKMWTSKMTNGKSVDQMFQDMSKGLDISTYDLANDVAKMTDDEYAAFMSTGTVPNWVQTGPNATAKKGVPGGLSTYYADGYGDPVAEKAMNDEHDARYGDTGAPGGTPSGDVNGTAAGTAGKTAFGPWWAATGAIADAADAFNQSQQGETEEERAAKLKKQKHLGIS